MTQPSDGAAPGAEPTVPEAEPAPPGTVRAVQYRGAELDAERGPGLGCFRFQLVLLVILLVLTPIGVNAGWPDWLTAGLLFVTLALLLVAGQTVIFLLRLVAADRRGRRRPLASATRTVGELADASRRVAHDAPRAAATSAATSAAAPDEADEAPHEGIGADPDPGPDTAPNEDGRDGDRSVRQ